MDYDGITAEVGATSNLLDELAAEGFREAVEVGRGGFGVVFRCRQVQLDRLVAVKVLTANLDENRARFLREQRAMGRLTGHPNIVAVLAVGETTGGYPYLVMPYCTEGSLMDRIAAAGRLSPEEAVAIGAKVAGALHSAHQLGVIHRDVKPGNVLLTAYGEPALTDFGIAHMAGGFRTATGTFTGSPAFAAPEVLAGDAPTPSSDVYGLGATLFSMLTGHAAFERHDGEQVVAQFLRIAAEPVPDLRHEEVPADLAAIVEAAMAREPTHRPSAAQLGQQLQQLKLTGGRASVRVWNHGQDADQRHPEKLSTSPATDRSRHNLPHATDDIVGRRGELLKVNELLSRSRLVTLTGVGGVGKTALAIHAANGVLTGFADGVWFIELGDLRDPALLTEVVAAALGIRDQVGRPLLAVIADVLSPQHVLLVLDNCEHVIEAVAAFADTLLHECPRLRILATSREVLDIEGEAVLPVMPLAVPPTSDTYSTSQLADCDSVAMLVMRAQAIVGGFALSADNATAVARICERLEGLPLAIELATARLQAMSVQQLADALTDHYQLLSGRSKRGLPPRQRTLAACIEWSYQLCTPPQQELWERLSVFSASFDVQAAQSVCATDQPIEQLLDGLTGLVEKSILIRSEHAGSIRFRLLETLRDYGAARLAGHSELQHRLQDNHATYYRTMLRRAGEQWFSPQQADWIARLRCEMPNLRQALNFSVTHDPESALEMTALLRPLWVFGGMLGEGRRWLESALAARTGEATVSRLKALAAVAHITALGADLPNAEHQIAQAREVLIDVEDPSTEGYIDFVEGFCAMISGDVARADDRCRQAIAKSDDFEARVESMLALGWLSVMTGDIDQAASWIDQGLALAESRGDTVMRTHAMATAALIRWQQGNLDGALRAIADALRLAQVIKDSWSGAQFLEISGWITAARDPRQAAVYMGAAHAACQASGATSLAMATMGSFHEQTAERVRSSLGAADHDSAFSLGTSLSFDEAVALALSGPAGGSA